MKIFFKGVLIAFSMSVLILMLINYNKLPGAEGTALAMSFPVPQSSKLAPFFTPEVQYWGSQITAWSNQRDIDPNLAATVMQIESCGNPMATSSANAKGLFQVMPFHFLGMENPYDPETNANRGLNYLKASLDKANGDFRLALAGYNGGIGVISRSEASWPSETKRYVQFGAPIYEDALRGNTTSDALQNWLSNYGIWLCRQANKQLGLN